MIQVMAKVKVYNRQKNRQGKRYMPPIIQFRGITIVL